MTDPNAALILTAAEIDEIERRVGAATPGPWYYNGYSRIASGHYGDIEDGEMGVVQELPYPDGKRPGPPFLVGADLDWLDKRHAAYETDPDVAYVPAEYGDTATGRHAADAILIEHARQDIPALIATVRHERERAEDAERLLEGLKRGSCWCDVGIGNPMMRDHSAACVAVSAFLAQRPKEAAQP